MIYVVRHGQTDLNKQGRLQGRLGEPLNETGIKQASNLKEKLKDIHFIYVYSSPQERAIQTAEISTGISPIIDNRLDVFDLGEADKLKREEVKLSGGVPDPHIYNGVEELQSYIKRVFEFMRELECQYERGEGNILISGHKCTTGCIGVYFKGIPEDRNILKFSSGNGNYNSYPLKIK